MARFRPVLAAALLMTPALAIQQRSSRFELTVDSIMRGPALVGC